MNLLPFTIAWIVLGVIILLLAWVRRVTAEHEDDSVHLSGASEKAVAEQKVIAQKLEKIDKWGKLLTIILAVTGVILAILYGFKFWEDSSRVGLS